MLGIKHIEGAREIVVITLLIATDRLGGQERHVRLTSSQAHTGK